MADKKFSVKTEEIQKAANLIKEKAARFEAEYKKMYAETANLSVEWKGQSSSTFNSKLQEYKGKLEQMTKLLENLNSSLIQVAKKYDDTDAELASKASSLLKF
jgi:WXG100 family type VII secretion target